jgi:hypothetical protein
MSKFKMTVVAVALTSAALFLARSNAYAVASYSRQTGLSCTACHTTFPELTSVGRDFKLNGYTTTAEDTISETGTNKYAPLSLLKTFPLSASVHADVTATGKRQPASQNPTAEFQALNLYLAGQITPHFGTFLQISYESDTDHFSLDSSDVRYANETKLAGKSLIWGFDVNNNPTYEDVWNSVPAQSFPFDAAPGDAGFAPAATTLIDGALATQVIGGGPYAMWNNHLYGTVALYRSQHIGAPQPDTGAGNVININEAAPYWRLAWQQNAGKDNYFEVGTYGLYVSSHPNSVSGPTDSYVDLAADATYEHTLPNHDLITVHSTFIYERSDLPASVGQGLASQPRHELKTYRLDVNYHWGSRVTLTAGPFITWGTSDNLLYAPGAVTGFSNGSPNNTGYIVQAAYWPWQNFEVGAQYRGFTQFNGAGSNYDGAGRNASDNNTLYVFAWVNF